MSACPVHVAILPPDIPCPSCAAGDPPDNAECVATGHVPRTPGRISDCARCGGAIAFTVSAGDPLSAAEIARATGIKYEPAQ